MSGFYQSTPPSEVFLMHFNPNHDRKNGQFTSGSGGNVNLKYQKMDDKLKQMNNVGSYKQNKYDAINEARDDEIKNLKKFIKSTKKELAILDKGEVDPNNPKDREQFEREADKSIKESLRMVKEDPDNYDHKTGKFLLTEKQAMEQAIMYASDYDVLDGSKDKLVDVLMKDHNKYSVNNEAYKSLTRQQLDDTTNALSILEKSKSEPLSKVLEDNGIRVENTTSVYDIIGKIERGGKNDNGKRTRL